MGAHAVTTARQLITEGACSAGCIAAATDAARCECACRGALHGIVSDADISVLIDGRRYGQRRRMTDLQALTEVL